MNKTYLRVNMKMLKGENEWLLKKALFWHIYIHCRWIYEMTYGQMNADDKQLKIL